MRLLVFSDIHGDRRALEKLVATEADHYFAAGDLATFGRGLDELGPIMQRHGDRMHVLPGNHESIADVERLCTECGFDSFHEKALQLDGYWIAGLGYSNPTPFRTPGEYTEEQLAERLAKFAGLDPLLLICHAPPKGTALDEIRQGLHAGSSAVREFIDKHQPRWFFCGHIHEAAGRSIEMGVTRAVNVGRRGYLLEL